MVQLKLQGAQDKPADRCRSGQNALFGRCSSVAKALIGEENDVVKADLCINVFLRRYMQIDRVAALLFDPKWRALLPLVAAAAVLTPGHGHAAEPLHPPSGLGAPAREEGVRWQSLTRAQRETLAPLERDWPSIEAWRKEKWLTIAGRYHSLTPEQRAHIQAQMTEWARLTPADRGLARIRFVEARGVSATDRRARWQAYQALTPAQRAQYAVRARTDSSPNSSDESGRSGVPSPTPLHSPRLVAPTLVQAAPGATTTLITRQPRGTPYQ